MDTPKPQFDRVGNEFVAYYDQVRGYMREHLVRHNLAPHVASDTPLMIADVGGGDGRDAIWLAEQGHTVMLVDESQQMLDRAVKNFSKNASPQARAHITYMSGGYQSALEAYGTEAFDMVLSHGVLLYDLEDPQKQLNALFKLVKPLGKVSLLTTGLEGTRLELATERRYDEIPELEKTGHFTNHLGAEAVAYSSERLTEMIQKAGGKVLDWYGIRVITNYMYNTWAEMDPRELQSMLDIEKQLGAFDEMRTKGKMLHFIAEKV